MPRKPDHYNRWYEVQRLANRYEDGSGGEWVLWKEFHYDFSPYLDGVRLSKNRLEARRKALTAAKVCFYRLESPVRVVHVEQFYVKGISDA